MSINIHHATASKIESLGGNIEHYSLASGEDFIRVTFGKGRSKLVGSFQNPKEVAPWYELVDMMSAEYPCVQLDAHGDHFFMTFKNGDDECNHSWDELPDITDIVDVVREHGFEADAAYEEEAAKGNGGPTQKYKALYAERGDANSNSDWLAQLLDGMFRLDVDKGRAPIDIEALEAWLIENDIEFMDAKFWNRGNNGQKSMGARNAVRRKIRETGFVMLLGKKHVAPAEFMAELELKFRDPTQRKKASK